MLIRVVSASEPSETLAPATITLPPPPQSPPPPPTPSASLPPPPTADEAQEKLDQVLRLYAASTQHLAGMKIVTRESAEKMDIRTLKRLQSTLEDLVAARSKLLVRTLAERESLRNEMHLKSMVLKPIITFLNAENKTPRHSYTSLDGSCGATTPVSSTSSSPPKSTPAAAAGRSASGASTPVSFNHKDKDRESQPPGHASSKRFFLRLWQPSIGDSGRPGQV
jgi:hypothetical protein